MAITAKALWETVQLATSAEELYTATAITTIKAAAFLNTDTNARTITVYLVPSGESAADNNMILKEYELAPGQPFVPNVLLNQVLQIGDAVYALASAASVINTRGSGFTQ